MLIPLLIFCPLLAALLSFISKRRAILELIAVLSAIIEFVIGLIIMARVTQSGGYVFNAYFAIDALGMIIGLVVITIGLLASLYSVGYLRAEQAKDIIGPKRIRQYYLLLELFILAMIIAFSSANPVIMWIAIEATTLVTVFLVSFYNKPTATEAAWKYLIINSIGLLLGFLGTLLYFTIVNAEGSNLVTWQSLLLDAGKLNPLVAKIAFVFAFIGYGTKMGLAPMHTWLPDAHSKAPAPISALLSGALLNVALLAILRYKQVTDAAVGPAFTGKLLVFFGILSLIISAFIIQVQKNYKRLMAYSSIEHMGIIAIGFGFGGAGIFAALLHLIYHSLTKSLLFFTSGNIFLKYGSTKIANIRGVLKILPLTGILFMIGFLAITGMPPFGTFITEFNILYAGISSPVLVMIILVCLALIFVGFLRHSNHLLFHQAEDNVSIGENNAWTIIPPIILTIILVVLSFYLPSPVRTLLTQAALIK